MITMGIQLGSEVEMISELVTILILGNATNHQMDGLIRAKKPRTTLLEPTGS